MSYNEYRRGRPRFVSEMHDEQFFTGFSHLWSSGDFSDFTIVVDDSKKFRVHKAVLSVHSPVFTAMFLNDMQEQSTGIGKIPDFSAESVEHFLAFMYTGQLKDESQVMDIFALAALYNVSKLKSMCEIIIESNVDLFNVYEIMTLGDLHSSVILRKAASKAIREMFPGKNLPNEILRNPTSIQKLIAARDVLDGKVRAANKVQQEAEMEYEDFCQSLNIQSTRSLQSKAFPNHHYDEHNGVARRMLLINEFLESNFTIHFYNTFRLA